MSANLLILGPVGILAAAGLYAATNNERAVVSAPVQQEQPAVVQSAPARKEEPVVAHVDAPPQPTSQRVETPHIPTRLGWNCVGVFKGDFERIYDLAANGDYKLTDSATQTISYGPAWSSVVDVAPRREWIKTRQTQTDRLLSGSLEGIGDLVVGKQFEATYLRESPGRQPVEQRHVAQVLAKQEVMTPFAGQQTVFVVSDAVSSPGFSSKRVVHYAPKLKVNIAGSYSNNSGQTVECKATDITQVSP